MKTSNQFMLVQDSSGVWCAARRGFPDLTLDPAGWGATRERAVLDPMGAPEFRELAAKEGWPDELTAADFIETREPERAKLEATWHSDDRYEQELARRNSLRVVRD